MKGIAKQIAAVVSAVVGLVLAWVGGVFTELGLNDNEAPKQLALLGVVLIIAAVGAFVLVYFLIRPRAGSES